jgi:hypothetical protein
MTNGMSMPAPGISRAMRAKPPSGWTKSFCISTIIRADLSISGSIIATAIICAPPVISFWSIDKASNRTQVRGRVFVDSRLAPVMSMSEFTGSAS